MVYDLRPLPWLLNWLISESTIFSISVFKVDFGAYGVLLCIDNIVVDLCQLINSVILNWTDISTNQCASITVSSDEGEDSTHLFKLLIMVEDGVASVRMKSIQIVTYYEVYSFLYIFFWQSAIGEGMTRRDHADVSNQV